MSARVVACKVLLFALSGTIGVAWAAPSDNFPSALANRVPSGGVLSPDAEQGLVGAIAFGYNATRGGANTRNMNGRIDLKYTTGHWFHTLTVVAQYSSKEKVSNVNRLDVGGQANYLFSEHNYVFAHVDYQRKQFGSFTRRTSEGVGYGRRVLNGADDTLDFEAGIGSRQTRLRNGTRLIEKILLLGGAYHWDFSDNSTFSQELAIGIGVKNTYTKSVTQLRTNLIQTLALVLAYTIEHNSHVLPGSVNTDVYTSVSLQYSF